jgi:protein O-mannosyl-transferase
MRDRLILTFAALVAFGASLAGSFHFDDYAIFADPSLTAGRGWLEVWRPLQTRPLTYLTFWLNFQLGGKDPVGYHALNLALHVAAVLLLYEALSKLLGRPAALLGATVFAVHPIQAEAVNYIWARSTLLAALICLLALRSWIAGRDWMAVVWFAAALLAKEECAAFPIFLLLLRRAWKPAAVMLTLSMAAGVRVLWALEHVAGAPAGAQAGISPGQYLLAQGAVIWRYLRLLIVPWGFTVDPRVSVPPLWMGLLAWAGIVALAIIGRRFLLGGLILLAPSSSIFPAADLAADRRMYLPMIAFSAAAALPLARIPRTVQIAALTILAALSVMRTQVWRTEKSLWSEAVRRAPGKLRPKLQLARVSHPAEAMNLIAEAKKLAPSDPAVASEAGKMLLLLGRPQDALPEFGRALALLPRDAQAFNNRGVALQALGQAYAARRDFEHALQLDPCLFDARLNLLHQGSTVPAPPNCRYTPDQQRDLSSQR